MSYHVLPSISPEETVVWFDLEGVLMEDNISLYLLSHKPFLMIKSFLNGVVKATCNNFWNRKKDFTEEWTEDCKKHYEGRMTPLERSSLGRLIFNSQSEQHKDVLLDLFKVLKEDGYDLYVITSANREIAYGFLNSFPEELRLPQEKIFASDERYVDRNVKAAIVRDIKRKSNKIIVGAGDTRTEEDALEESDVPYIVRSKSSFLMPCKIQRGLKVDNLYAIKSMFDMVHYERFFREKDLNL